ncbi:MAG TPA: translation elongation factor Ts [Bacillota bacterium]|nr:translation elongation factor Ts [Bacillota bacterium]HUM56027.1 translation elongation factor Ts [Bacillota bacterium]
MSVTASMVKELREITGAGMMDCKNVLMETDGDIEKAVELLREKGIAKAAKKADRIAAQGLVRTAFSKDGKTAAIIEVNSETDFVAKNQEFIDFVDSLAKLVMENDVKSKDEFMDMPFEGSTVQEVLKSKIAKIGENMNIRRFEKFCEADTVYKGYIHGNGTIGVIVGIKTEASGEETEEAGKDVAMQVASMNPRFLDGNDVDPEFIAEEKKILTQQVLNEGKKPEMVDRIVEGKLKKELKEYCLLEQKFVKDSEVTVKQYIENTAKAKGKEMEVTSFVRFEVGEGIEKKEEDFAEEVAKQMDMNK